MSVKKTLHVPKVGDMVVYPYWEDEQDNYFVVLSKPKRVTTESDLYLHTFKAWNSSGKMCDMVYCLSYREDNNTDETSTEAWRYLDKAKNR
jgi:hypothetical protein